jgi:hypothetical protein
MPIEIKELHIKVTVNTPSAEVTPKVSGAPAEGGGDANSVVAECVEQVLEILKQKSER